MDITITISDAEYKALEYVAASPEEWADNAVTNRVKIAMDEIVSLYTNRALDEGVSIPSTREEIVTDAYARGWIQTAAEVTQSSSPDTA